MGTSEKNRILTTFLGLKKTLQYYCHQTQISGESRTDFIKIFSWIKLVEFLENLTISLPESLSNSLAISSRDFDFGILPTKSRVLGTETFTFSALPGAISIELS